MDGNRFPYPSPTNRNQEFFPSAVRSSNPRRVLTELCGRRRFPSNKRTFGYRLKVTFQERFSERLHPRWEGDRRTVECDTVAKSGRAVGDSTKVPRAAEKRILHVLWADGPGHRKARRSPATSRAWLRRR